MGIALAAPEKHVINLIGDGAFGMTGMEIDTAVRYGIKTITVILDNSSMGLTPGMSARVIGHDPISNQSFNIEGADYAGIAKGLGAIAISVEKPQELRPAFEKALIADRAVVIAVKTHPNALDASICGGADCK